MVRSYKRKTNRNSISEENIASAISDVLEGRLSIRNAAAAYDMKKSTLANRLMKFKKRKIENNQETEGEASQQEKQKRNTEDRDNLMTERQEKSVVSNWPFKSKYTTQQVFTTEYENLLCKYLLQSSKINYGLTYLQAQKLAFQYAKKLNIKYPASWDRDERAGKDWIKSFMNRFPSLTLRKPENTSLARATGFNEVSVGQFFDNLERALQKYRIPPEKIYNLDETGVTTVLQAPKVIAETGIKQVGQVVSGERGELVTFCALINSVGNTIPPVYIFPRSKYKPIFLRGAPNGSLGLANKSGSGWMTSTLFLEVVKHIQKFTKCTKDDPILVVLDNHESHTSLETILFCRDNGIIFVTFPPHCTHRLQPLDVCLYGPFKNYLKIAFNDWLLSNPGRRISIYEIAELTGKAYQKAFTIDNICSGFKKCGIVPFDRNAFGRDDFTASYVSNTMSPSYQESTHHTDLSADTSPLQGLPVYQNDAASASTSTAVVLTPECVQPYPKAPRNTSTTRKGRKQGKSRILTETPEKNWLEEKRMEKEKGKRNVFGNTETNKKVSKAKLNKHLNKDKCDDETDTSENDVDFKDDESDCCSEFDKENSDEEFLKQIIPLLDPTTELPNIFPGDYLLVKYCSKKSVKFFVGEVEGIENGQYQMNFLRKRGTGFIFPAIVDKDLVDFEQIELKLPRPKEIHTTVRANSIKKFSVDLSTYVF